MRKIKFRAWDKILNKWIYLTLQELCCTNIDWIKTSNWCEFTGLKDKNGKEVYEGDIIKLAWSNKHKAEVYWGKEGLWCLRWNKEGEGYNYRMFAISDIEVIGNVFENKELLK